MVKHISTAKGFCIDDQMLLHGKIQTLNDNECELPTNEITL